MIELDFETRSRIDITVAGAWKYSIDPSTDILCFSWTFYADDEPKLWKPGEPFPEWVFNEAFIKELGGIKAHNAAFEQAIWLNIGVARHRWARIPPQYWRCSMAQAAAHSVPMSLDKAGIALNLPIKKDMSGKRTMLQLSQTRKPSKANPKEWFEPEDYPEKFAELYAYNMEDVKTERCLGQALPPLTAKEQWVWILNEIINQRGLEIDIPLVHKCLEIIEEVTTSGIKRVQEITNGEVDSPMQVAKLQAWCVKNGANAENVKKATIEALLEDPSLPSNVREVLTIRQALSKTSTKKLYAMIAAAAPDNRVRYTMLYHGASTGRFAGRLIQIQNFPRGTIENVDEAIEDFVKLSVAEILAKYSDPMEVISSCLRGMIIAKAGHRLIAADYNAIETRVLMWLAGETHALGLYATGADLYKDMASFIYDKPVDEITKAERQVGKATILGAGFGMGGPKFHFTCVQQGIEITEEQSIGAIAAYRAKYPGVPLLWKTQEQAAIHAVMTGEEIHIGQISWRFDKERNFLYCRLPSGRDLAYYSPALGETYGYSWVDETGLYRFKRCQSRQEMHDEVAKNTKFPRTAVVNMKLTFLSVNSVTKQWERNDTWGGSLVENIVQAIARDCMVDGLFRTEKNKYPTIMTVHDEVVAEVPEGFGSVEEFENLLSISPEWATDLPLKTEGWEGKRYRK